MSTPAEQGNLWIGLIIFFEIWVPYVFSILFISLACISGVFWRNVQSWPELYEPPYSPYIKSGTLAPFVTTLIGVTVFVLSIFIKHNAGSLFIWTIARFGLCAGLIASIVLQSRYMPLPLGSCENFGVWRDPTGIPEGTPTMFEVIPIQKGHNKYGRPYTNRPCDTLVMLWRFEIALAVFMGVLGILAWILLSCAAVPAPKNNQAPSSSTNSAFKWLGKPFKFISEFIGRQRGKLRRKEDRKEAEAKLLANDPESLEYVDHEMGIRIRPV